MTFLLHIYVAVSICRRFGFLKLFLTPFSFVAVEFLRRYEKSENCTISPWYERYEKSKDSTKSPWYESFMVRKVHKWYETSMVRKVYGTKSLVPPQNGSKVNNIAVTDYVINFIKFINLLEHSGLLPQLFTLKNVCNLSSLYPAGIQSPSISKVLGPSG